MLLGIDTYEFGTLVINTESIKKVEFYKSTAFIELQGETDKIEISLEVWEKAEVLLDDLGVLKYVD